MSEMEYQKPENFLTNVNLRTDIARAAAIALALNYVKMEFMVQGVELIDGNPVSDWGIVPSTSDVNVVGVYKKL